MWIVYALLAAVSAAAVIVLTKAGLKNLDSSLAFAIQSVFILIISWAVVFMQSTLREAQNMSRKVWLFLIAAGIATTVSTLLSYKALKMGKASNVTALERLSLPFAVLFAAFFLKERVTWQLITGGLLMIGGAILIAYGEESGS